ncbi:M20 family metallopeptidase [Actinomadura madurae]|uniref:M20 metallopeptidase family protein n=1 Tax=Actinomadura madurae TaxID=1993 RepID=UPI002027383B|nr:M20 family metallopeptidase [Actinomadura madurae]URN06724.1 M20 family metallopeptidase [Actinomadura madurae]
MTADGSLAPPAIGTLQELLRLLADEIPAAVELRHRLHRVPELGSQEHATVALIEDSLPVQGRSFAGTGRLVSIGDASHDAVWVRAELDALAIRERTGAPYAATGENMHACGHDVHLAALVALVRAAHRMRDGLPARLTAVFQPSEERHPSGALALVNDPELAVGVRAAIAVHVHPELPWGGVGIEPGAVNAAADAVHIVIKGAGGHAAYPHQATDPVLALAHLVVGLNGLVGRQVDPTRAATLTVGSVRAGSTENIIPDEAEAKVTFRALDERDQDRLRDAVRRMATGVAEAHGCTAELTFPKSEPALVNDDRAALAARSLAAIGGFRLAPPWRSCGGDDFAHYRAVCPALMIFVGLRGAPEFQPAPLHQSDFLPPDGAVAAAARALALGYVAGLSVDPAS